MDHHEEDKEFIENHTKDNKKETGNDNLDHRKIGEHVDVKIGWDNGAGFSANSDQNILEEILVQMEKQTEDLHQIKRILSNIYNILIIAGAVAIIAILIKMS